VPRWVVRAQVHGYCGSAVRGLEGAIVRALVNCGCGHALGGVMQLCGVFFSLCWAKSVIKSYYSLIWTNLFLRNPIIKEI
jgi:hypothetical protein